MKYVLRVHSDHEFMPLWYAFVDLSDTLLEHIKKIRHLAGPLRDMERFLRVEFLDYTPAFTGQCCPSRFDQYVTTDEYHDSNKMRLPDDIELPESERIEVATLQVEDDGFRWTVRLKHCDQDGYTETLYYNEVDDG